MGFLSSNKHLHLCFVCVQVSSYNLNRDIILTMNYIAMKWKVLHWWYYFQLSLHCADLDQVCRKRRILSCCIKWKILQGQHLNRWVWITIYSQHYAVIVTVFFLQIDVFKECCKLPSSIHIREIRKHSRNNWNFWYIIFWFCRKEIWQGF